MPTDCKEYNSVSDFVLQPKTDGLVNILYCNARSLANTAKFQLFLLYVTQVKPDFICITETWFNPGDEDFYYIKGFVLFSAPRVARRGGGVAVYVKDSYSATVVNQIQEDYSVIHIKMKLGKTNYHLINVYNPQRALSNLTLEGLDEILVPVKEPCIVIGDFNIDLLSNSTLSLYYRDLMQSHGLSIVNNSIPSRQGTLIDHVWTSDANLSRYSYCSIDDGFFRS